MQLLKVDPKARSSGERASSEDGFSAAKGGSADHGSHFRARHTVRFPVITHGRAGRKLSRAKYFTKTLRYGKVQSGSRRHRGAQLKVWMSLDQESVLPLVSTAASIGPRYMQHPCSRLVHPLASREYLALPHAFET